MSPRVLTAAALGVLLLEGCAQQPAPPPASVDLLNDGIAATCSYSPVQPKPGATVEATITMTNDGWCAYRASEAQGRSYLLGLVKERPAHGELNIRQWNGESRVEYYPAAGFVGTDKFLVALRPSGGQPDALVRVTATVARGAAAAAAPAAAPQEEKPKPKPTTRRSRTTSHGHTRH